MGCACEIDDTLPLSKDQGFRATVSISKDTRRNRSRSRLRKAGTSHSATSQPRVPFTWIRSGSISSKARRSTSRWAGEGH